MSTNNTRWHIPVAETSLEREFRLTLPTLDDADLANILANIQEAVTDLGPDVHLHSTVLVQFDAAYAEYAQRRLE
jgi:hypothetical protein